MHFIHFFKQLASAFSCLFKNTTEIVQMTICEASSFRFQFAFSSTASMSWQNVTEERVLKWKLGLSVFQ